MGTVAKRISREVYSEFIEMFDDFSFMGFDVPVEHDNDPEADPPNIFVQQLRITDELLDKLVERKYDIAKITTEKRLNSYLGYKKYDCGVEQSG